MSGLDDRQRASVGMLIGIGVGTLAGLVGHFALDQPLLRLGIAMCVGAAVGVVIGLVGRQ